MERLIPNFDINKNKFIVLESTSKYFLLDLKDKKGTVNVGLEDGLEFDLLLKFICLYSPFSKNVQYARTFVFPARPRTDFTSFSTLVQ